MKDAIKRHLKINTKIQDKRKQREHDAAYASADDDDWSSYDADDMWHKLSRQEKLARLYSGQDTLKQKQREAQGQIEKLHAKLFRVHACLVVLGIALALVIVCK